MLIRGTRIVFLRTVAACFMTAWLLFYTFPSFFSLWDQQISDQMHHLRYSLLGKGPVSHHVIHVDIDDTAITRDQFPVNDLSAYARLIRLLGDAYVDAIVFDMIFPRCPPTPACPDLVAATRIGHRVYYPVAVKPGATAPEHTPGIPDKFIWHLATEGKGEAANAHLAFSNFPALNQAATGIGHITCFPDPDGVYRQFPLLFRMTDGYSPAMIFRAVCDLLRVGPDQIRVRFGDSITLTGALFPDGRKGNIRIPIDKQGRMPIPFAGPWRDSFTHFSASELLALEDDPAALDFLAADIEGCLVVVSDVSTGGRDFGPIPIEPVYPLSGIHANVANAILTQWFFVPFSTLQSLLLDAVFALLLLLTAQSYKSKPFLYFSVFSVGVFVCISLLLFLKGNMIGHPARTLMALIFTSISITTIKFMKKEQDRILMKARMEHYFAPTVLKKILKDPARIRMAEKKEITVLFSDIKGFTAWSAARSAETIHQTLNRYFEAMSAIVFTYEGTIDKFIGDGMMVFFGDPVPQSDHALRAVQAACEMQKKVRELRSEWAEDGGMRIHIRIGIHTGEAVVGAMGSLQRLDYTVIGANVNLAQRLESLAPEDGILISEAVRQQIKAAVPVIPCPPVNAKGFPSPIPVYQVKTE
ncbi:MAG: hypothetical protein CSA22_07475 [Deltaproteobacteria bacterium]|nr:MAG: hypothetical protein CSA22_07475 [Deltaproteobacteria bacterium]